MKIEGQIAADFETNHLRLQLIEKEKELMKRRYKLKKAALFPEITLGYYSMTMQGMGQMMCNMEVEYDFSHFN